MRAGPMYYVLYLHMHNLTQTANLRLFQVEAHDIYVYRHAIGHMHILVKTLGVCPINNPIKVGTQTFMLST